MTKAELLVANIETVIEILGKHKRIENAKKEIKERLDLDINQRYLRDIFQKYNFGQPGQYLAGSELQKEIKKESEENHSDLIFLDKKASKFELDDWMEHLKSRQNLEEKATPFQRNAKIKVKTEKPIAICFSDDWHLGSLGCNYNKFCEDIDFILNTDNLYIAGIGDCIDNFMNFKSVSAMFSQAIPPKHQKMLLMKLVEKLVSKNKIIFAGWANHVADFEERLTGDSPTSYMLARKVVFFNGVGLAQVFVGKIEYTILISHKARFNSFLNPNHTQRRLHEIEYPADVTVSAHTHNPAFQWQYRYDRAQEIGKDFGGECLFIKTGTYKENDAYSERYFSRGKIGTPTVVFMPDHKEFIPFKNAEMAVRYMQTYENQNR